MPNNGKSRHSGLPIARISRLPNLVVQSVLPIAIHRLLHRLYPLASGLSHFVGWCTRCIDLWLQSLDLKMTLCAMSQRQCHELKQVAVSAVVSRR